ARLRAACLREQNDQVGMGGEVLKLRFQGDPDALERPLLRRGDRGERLLQLGGAAHEHRAEQTALRVEVVEQELLVDPGASRDLVHPRALEAAARELLARRRNDAQRSGISELRLQKSIFSTGWLMKHTVSEPQSVAHHNGGAR